LLGCSHTGGVVPVSKFARQFGATLWSPGQRRLGNLTTWGSIVLSGLLASARELRNPLTLGYAALFAFWLLAGEAINDAALADPLGRRLVTAVESIGSPAQLALVTFVAAMVGSLLWSSGASRLVRFLSVRAGHPDWDAMIDEARQVLRQYEEHNVTTYKGASGGKPSSSDARHRVPSPRHAAYLYERVEERQRTQAEMSFRVTLAVALVPVAIGLGVEGGGLWWWWLATIPVVWFDVALLKYTTLRKVRRYQIEDVQSRLQSAEEALKYSTEQAASTPGNRNADRRDYETDQKSRIATLKATEALLLLEDARPLARMFAFLEGKN